MKEIWDLATSAQVLPFTLLLVPIVLYWALASLGALDLDFLNVDTDADLDVDPGMDIEGGADGDGGGADAGDYGHGPFLGIVHGALKVVNGTDVPIMAVLSFLFIFLWLCAMLGNLWFNPEGGDFRGTVIGFASLGGAIVLTRLATKPLKPVFRAMKGDGTPNRPVVGRAGTVRTGEVSPESGQVEISEGGEVLLLNARLGADAEPLPRGTEVVVYDYDKARGIYYVKSISSNQP